jgi:peptidyl-prolyl cis-trans isomerase A (cyclophilin A)
VKRLTIPAVAVLLLSGCPETQSPPEVPVAGENPGTPTPPPPSTGAVAPAPSTGASIASDDAERAHTKAAPGPEYTDAMIAGAVADPANGQFSLAQATAGLPGQGPLKATIKTNIGSMKCTLDPEHAPNSVANFVGLARGKRPWKTPDGKWVLRPAYDNTSFHRIIKGFMIQGGDPTGTGAGDPGYTIKDEGHGRSHDRAGLLCMANRGPDTNGMQFFVTDAVTPHLDRSRTAYTIFGECGPLDVVHGIAAVPVGVADRPQSPVTIEQITIER